MTGTSTSTPTIVANAAPEVGPNSVIATAGSTITDLANVVDSQINAGVSFRSPRGRLYVHLKTCFQAGRPTADILTRSPSNRLNPRLEDYQFGIAS